MARTKRLSPEAEKTTIGLTPDEQVALDVIRGRRKKRGEERTSPSEVVVDGLWLILEKLEGLSRNQISELLAVSPPESGTDNIKPFPRGKS
jgi:hypothetical protein